MNDQIRRLLAMLLFMMLALLGSLTYVQFFAAPSLGADGRNVRQIYSQYGRERGKIMVTGQALATSQPVNDRFKYLRSYPQGAAYAHITGYFPTALAGQPTGLEWVKGQVLTGQASSMWTQRVADLITGHQPQGGSLSLTIDPAVQQAAITALNGRKGAVAAINPTTGQILALYSNPSFDPNRLSSHDPNTARQAYETLNADPNKPLVSKAIGGDLYPPGSVFKIVTAAAMLESGKYAPAGVLDAPDSLELPNSTARLGNYGNAKCGSGRVEMSYAFRLSCNTAFAKAAMDLGDDALAAKARDFGFNSAFDIPLPVTASRYPNNSELAFTANAAIGQQDVRVTPLQMAMVSAAVANRGVLMKPYLIDQELTADLQVNTQYSAQEYSRPLSEVNAAALRDMMVSVVNDGTGRAAALPGVRVAGKTGTAENAPGTNPTVWFVGFAPADAPTIALALVLDGEDLPSATVTGGSLAAPAARVVLASGVKQ